MASYEKGTFQRDFNKYAGSSDLSKAPKSMIKERELSEKRKHRMKLWTTFYRRNVHRFVEHYFGIKLFPYQKYARGIDYSGSPVKRKQRADDPKLL